MQKFGFVAIFTLFVIGLTVPSFAQTDDTIVVLNTELGKITIEFFPNDAPNHVNNFIQLAESGFYDNTVFHRIIPTFMIQGGDPLTIQGEDTINQWGTGGPDHQVSEEFNDIRHIRGIVSMARSNDPNSAGSQFFIVHADSPHLDRQYTVFGRIVTQESFETLDKIANLETTNTKPNDWTKAKITSVDVLQRSDVENILELGRPARIASNVPTQDNQLYSSEKLGIEFKAPTGWLLQEPQKSRPDVPDVVAVTSGTSSLVNPSISVTISHAAGQTLEEYMDERRQLLIPAIESGQLTVNDEESGELFGRDIFAINAVGTFTNGELSEDVQFTEITFLEQGKFFAITYTTSTSEYDTYYDNFLESIESFKVLSPSPISPVDNMMNNNDDTNPDDNGCLIATAAYGSEMAPQVQFLREIRDDTVLATQSGAAFMTGFNQLYYSFSPTVADWERQNPIFKEAVKIAIIPLLSSLAILNYVDIDSESEMLGYGMGVIAMNVGMYLIAPAVVIHRVFRK